MCCLPTRKKMEVYMIDDVFTLDVVEDLEVDSTPDVGSSNISIKTEDFLDEEKVESILDMEDVKIEEGVFSDGIKQPDLRCTQNKPDKAKETDVGKKKSQSYECDICSYTTHNFYVFFMHQKMHSNENTINELKCPHCVYITFSKKELDFHVAQCLSNNNVIRCTQCDFITSKRKYLKNHVKTKHRKDAEPQEFPVEYKCKQCNFTCRNLDSYQLHLFDHLNKDEQLKCKFCPFITIYKRALTRHKMKCVLSDKNVTCSYCSFSTFTSNSLNRHIRTKHKRLG